VRMALRVASKLALFALLCVGRQPLGAQTTTPDAVVADPPTDKAPRPDLAIFTVPSHGTDLDAWLYLASGANAHGTVILAHGLPGYEMNADLAQSIRRWDRSSPLVREDHHLSSLYARSGGGAAVELSARSSHWRPAAGCGRRERSHLGRSALRAGADGQAD